MNLQRSLLGELVRVCVSANGFFVCSFHNSCYVVRVVQSGVWNTNRSIGLVSIDFKLADS